MVNRVARGAGGVKRRGARGSVCFRNTTEKRECEAGMEAQSTEQFRRTTERHGVMRMKKV